MNNKSINKLYSPAPLGSPAIEDRVRKSQSSYYFISLPVAKHHLRLRIVIPIRQILFTIIYYTPPCLTVNTHRAGRGQRILIY